MKRFSWVIISVLIIVISSMLPLAFTEAAQAGVGKSSLAELTNGADSVIVGTVVERSSYWNDEHTGIYTSVVLSVEERLKGTASQDRITVTLLGGEVDGMWEWVSSMPSFDQGEKAVVFLKKLSKAQLPKVKDSKLQLSEEQFEVYGGFQGKFAIKQGRVGNLPVAEFKERVSKILQGQTLPDEELDVPLSVATFPYSYSGYCWPHPPAPVVSYRINENTADCTGEGTAVQAAAATWSAAGASFSFSYAGPTTVTDVSSYDGVNKILWKNLGAVTTIAQTSIWGYGTTITECDMEFNDYYTFSTAATPPAGQFDTQTIALHEFGHYLLLDDLYDAADSAKVMYGYGSTGTTKRALHADDIAGIRYIYGSSLTAPTVTNSTGASDVTSTQARLNGELTSTGGASTTVHIYWGPSNGGTTPGSWATDVNLGVKAAGTFYTDISSLTNGTTYYYRCYAQNSAGDDWADATASFTTSSPPVKLLGMDDATATAAAGASYILMDRFAAVSSGNLSQIRVKCTGAGSVKVALYADSSGNPGSLLVANNAGASVTSGWNTINLSSSPSITSGTYYWIAFNSLLACVGYAPVTDGAILYRAFDYSNDFPASAGTGFTTSPSYHCLTAGWGTVVITAPTVTNSTGASNITSTSARLNGEVTSTGNAPTSVTVYWGTTDGGTTPSSWANNVPLGTKPAGTFYTAISSLTASTTYYYRCYAQNSAGDDWADSTASFTTSAPPSPPSLLSPGEVIIFKWSAATGATKYWLQVNTGADFTGTNMFNAELGNVLEQEVSGFSLGATYYWRVKAGNAAGWSTWSSVRSVVANAVP